MAENNQLITITQSGRIGDFKVEPDNVMVLPGTELYEVGDKKSREAPIRIGEGTLTISRTTLAFTGIPTTVTFSLSAVTRVQPYDTAIDIYEKGRKEPFKFSWGNKIIMKCVGIPGDDGMVKPLSGRMVAQFIINERNRVGNLLKAK
jgi:hypothetical protein